MQGLFYVYVYSYIYIVFIIIIVYNNCVGNDCLPCRNAKPLIQADDVYDEFHGTLSAFFVPMNNMEVI